MATDRTDILTDNLTVKQREILDEAWAAHRRGEDVASICERLGPRHGMSPPAMARLVVNLTLVDRQLELIDRGEPAFTNADGAPVLQLPPLQTIKDIANGKPNTRR